ncbi:hypothetical protein CC80DRAFT_488107 [Byssothecium circinans]|uniref:Uncharacterized protein n=1 Tax=Byssothecium circinans TaxID=147558 RepID=A0A6A5UKR3_9PLEO|nr:hypothetical protein CC80DRAFT_488107 [Byssothecium circinans]
MRTTSQVERMSGRFVKARRPLRPMMTPKTNPDVPVLIVKSAGMTVSLKSHDNRLTFVEGPYPTDPTKFILKSGKLLPIGRGIGIAEQLSFREIYPSIKPFLGVKEWHQYLVQSLTRRARSIC